MTTPTTIESPSPPVIDPILFARGMAVIRIFFGIILPLCSMLPHAS